MRLAVLLDAVGEGLHAPHLGLVDAAAVLLDDALVLVDHSLDLLRGDILASHEDMLIERHNGPFSGFEGQASALDEECLGRFAHPIGAKPFEPARPERLSKAETRDDGAQKTPMRQAAPSVQPPAGANAKRGL